MSVQVEQAAGGTCDEHGEQADIRIHGHKVEQARAHGHGAGLPCQTVAHCQVRQDAQEAVCQLFSLHTDSLFICTVGG